MRTKTILFLLLTLPTKLLLSQDLRSFCERFLPGDVLQNKERREMISQVINSRSQLHPEMFYYTVIEFKELSEDTVGAHRQRIISLVNQKQRQFVNAKNE